MFQNKYEPKHFRDLFFQNDIARETLTQYITSKRKGNILLHGPYGTSKSTTAKIIAADTRRPHTQGFDWGVQTVACATFHPSQLALIERAWNSSCQPFEYAIFDEFDQLSMEYQQQVRAFLDAYVGKHGIIITTNHLRRIDPAIQSRCDVIGLPKLDAQVLLPLCQKILASEGVSLSPDQIKHAIAHENGDIRRVLRQLELIVHQV